MWQFIVSGQIPGTAIQVTFDHVVNTAIILLMMFFAAILVREQLAFRATINQQDAEQKIQDSAI